MAPSFKDFGAASRHVVGASLTPLALKLGEFVAEVLHGGDQRVRRCLAETAN